MAMFLVVAALTGSLLAFYEELYDATADWRTVSPPSAEAPLLEPAELIAAVERAAPEALFDRLELEIRPGEAVLFIPQQKSPDIPLDFDEIAIDPYTGAEVYRGTWGDLSEGWHQAMPFIFRLHYTLALGEVGRLLFGVVALVWTVDTILSFFLTLPAMRRGWLERWRKALVVRPPSAGSFKFNFDLHRAGGLWLWAALFVFAWSSVGFNLRPVYTSVMGAAGATDVFAELPRKAGPEIIRHDWNTLLSYARGLAAAKGEGEGFAVVAENALSYRASADAYEYRFRASNDLPTKRPQSRLYFDRESGEMVAAKSGRGNFTANGVNEWLVALHIASIGGRPYQVFVAALGLLIVVLTATGVIIWWRKRRARLERVTNHRLSGAWASK